MDKRSYGTGRLFVRADGKGRESWYGSWWAGTTRVQRKIGPKRATGTAIGLTRVQAERELRKRIDHDLVLAGGERKTLAEAGGLYVDHLEHVMDRKRSTIQDYRGYLSRHLEPFFGETPVNRIDGARVSAYLKKKRADGLSSKTVQNHLNFLHGVFAFSLKRGWVMNNPVEHVDRPKKSHSPHRRVRFLQPVELDALIAAVPDDPLGQVEGPLYLAAALTGLRQGELLALKWMDVDWLAGRIRVADNFTRGKFDSPKSHQGRLGADGRPARARARASLSTLRLPHRGRHRLLPPPHRQRARPVQDAQALSRSDHRRRRPPDHLSRAAAHVRDSDGRGRRAAARDPGVDGARRRQDHRDLPALRTRPTNGADLVDRAFRSPTDTTRRLPVAPEPS